jgi:hypothetical protein
MPVFIDICGAISALLQGAAKQSFIESNGWAAIKQFFVSNQFVVARIKDPHNNEKF